MAMGNPGVRATASLSPFPMSRSARFRTGRAPRTRTREPQVPRWRFVTRVRDRHRRWHRPTKAVPRSSAECPAWRPEAV